jgi:hypothetical protein
VLEIFEPKKDETRGDGKYYMIMSSVFIFNYGLFNAFNSKEFRVSSDMMISE